MELNNILNTENINIEQLQKGLKHIGLNLSRFDGVVEEQIPGLLELFKVAVVIDPKTTTKFTKMDLRSKLEKVLKGQPINNHSKTVATKEVTEKKAPAIDELKNNHQNSNVNRQPQFASINKKLGKVKFFDSTKGFGYVHSFTDNKDCFIHVSKLITSGIDEDDIVIFETVASRKSLVN
jgi:cold shock CspA family protein